MRQFHIGIAAQLAEHGGAFDGFVAQAVQLSEQGDATDFGHSFRLHEFKWL
jgi:hypothetical protein